MTNSAVACIRLTLAVSSTVNRECFFCLGSSSVTAHEFTLATFDLPVTADKKISGL